MAFVVGTRGWQPKPKMLKPIPFMMSPTKKLKSKTFQLKKKIQLEASPHILRAWTAL